MKFQGNCKRNNFSLSALKYIGFSQEIDGLFLFYSLIKKANDMNDNRVNLIKQRKNTFLLSKSVIMCKFIKWVDLLKVCSTEFIIFFGLWDIKFKFTRNVKHLNFFC